MQNSPLLEARERAGEIFAHSTTFGVIAAKMQPIKLVTLIRSVIESAINDLAVPSSMNSLLQPSRPLSIPCHREIESCTISAAVGLVCLRNCYESRRKFGRNGPCVHLPDVENEKAPNYPNDLTNLLRARVKLPFGRYSLANANDHEPSRSTRLILVEARRARFPNLRAPIERADRCSPNSGPPREGESHDDNERRKRAGAGGAI